MDISTITHITNWILDTKYWILTSFRFERHENRGLLTSQCPATLDRKILNGYEADVGEYPWLALLGYTSARGGNPQWKCGGSLIGDQHVLTAAHCVTGLPGSFKLWVLWT